MKCFQLSGLAAMLTLGIFSSAAPIEKAPLAARPFPTGDVRLLDGPFRQNMERNAAYLLSLDPDRLLHNTRKYCGLEPKGAIYGGWESRGIAGHSLGHYLTAISQQYAATGDKRFRERLDYIISEMAECQKRYGDGYIGAIACVVLNWSLANSSIVFGAVLAIFSRFATSFSFNSSRALVIV